MDVAKLSEIRNDIMTLRKKMAFDLYPSFGTNYQNDLLFERLCLLYVLLNDVYKSLDNLLLSLDC